MNYSKPWRSLLFLLVAAFFLVPLAAADILTLQLSQTHFKPGDTFELKALAQHTGPAVEAALVVALEVDGSYWFWPSWRQTPVDSQTVSLSQAWNELEIIPAFYW